MLPNYLKEKLSQLNIHSVAQIKQLGYLKIFKWLKEASPELSYKTLYDIYCISNNLPLNTIDKLTQHNLVIQYKQMLPSYIPLNVELINMYMSEALKNAQIAFNQNEVPIGAAIVKDNQIIGVGHNQTLNNCNIISHAELNAISMAQKHLNNYRLNDCDLYVTIEPCLMCSGAIINARIKRLFFGATETLTGACVSQYRVFDNSAVNHFTEVVGPVNNKLYGALLKEFFIKRRSINT